MIGPGVTVSALRRKGLVDGALPRAVLTAVGREVLAVIHEDEPAR